jgi:hypothetical protein
MNITWKQTGKGTWSSVEHKRGLEERPSWIATIRQRKGGKETVYSWTVGGHRKGTFSGIASSLAAAKDDAVAAVHTHILPQAEEEEAQVEATEASAEESES